MDVYNYKQRIEYWLRRIDESKFKNSELFHRFIDALRLVGVGDGRIVSYAQFAYEIIKVNDSDIRGWSREDVDRIASILISNKNWSYATIAIALRALKRLDEHAEHNNAYIITQYYRSMGLVEIAVIDDGIGIPNSLRNKFDDTITDSDLIIKAIEGYSSKSQPGRAFGLGSSLHMVEMLNGEVLIASLNGMVYLNNKEMLLSDRLYIKGTLIGIRIPIHDNVDAINVAEEADKRIDLKSKEIVYLGNI